ncbi:MAG: aconitate hydratase [Tissierellia bacterium]|nr:aconitate hydratase [Tissierellia bacterium]
MKLTITEKIIKDHIVTGNLEKGTEIGIRIDQTLTQDSTGTMAYLQFEALDIDRVKTKKSVAYIDHNMLQAGPENADDHLYIKTVAKKHGIYFSRPGNGICHQVHLERFGVPGDTLLGSDSHSPTCGGLGMLAIGAGGLDVAVAMAGGEYFLTMPQVVEVELRGRLNPGVAAKDIILKVLEEAGVKGGLNRVFEYTGEGVGYLSVPERATITNMGAELGATTSIFPSDDMTYRFLRAQKREEDFREIVADEGAIYDDKIIIDLDELEPMVACPHSPGNVVPVSKLKDIKVDQVAIGGCTNSSYMDLIKVAKILDGNTVAEDVSLVISPGSKQVLNTLAENGALSKLIAAGARILECGCGPCIGMGQAPHTDGVSLRTFNRNFKGRSGTPSADVYLSSPEVAAVSAIKGYITNPIYYDVWDLDMGDLEEFKINDNLIVEPIKDSGDVDIVRGPNIKPFPKADALKDELMGRVLIKVGDDITTDHIMPSNASLLPYRSNIPHLANYCMTPCDPEFPTRARENDGGIIIAGLNYGQGSSREHAALVPLYLGVRMVIAKSFARIHRENLINNGMLPLIFDNPSDFDGIDTLDELVIENLLDRLEDGKITMENRTKDERYDLLLDITERQRDILMAGGLLNWMKS